MHSVAAEPFRSEPVHRIDSGADPESFDERKQTKLVRFLEWHRPPAVPFGPVADEVFGREGVMEVGDSGDVPRVAGHGACQEKARVVNKVGYNRFHGLLRELVD